MSATKEKGQVEYVESGSGSDGKEGHGGEFYTGEDGGIAGHDKAYEKKLIRKIDYRLLPILGALYAISLIDRVNVCILSPLPPPVTWPRREKDSQPALDI
jgi:hypothetical protein